MTARKFSIAPMMDWTTRYCRVFHRALSEKAYLYTEMVTTGAIIHGHKERFLDFFPSEHPIGLQLGGSDVADLTECTRIAEEWGYDEVNLNIGCPSDRVQAGRIGACLMTEGPLVAECIKSMQDSVKIPVTVKTRIGVDDFDSWDFFNGFIQRLADVGCRVFIIHARKAWLKGLSPKENREVPPLHYEWVYRLKAENPGLEIHINGGIVTHEQAQEHLLHVDGVMVGREAYGNPWMLQEVDSLYYNQPQKIISRTQILESLFPFWEEELAKGVPLQRMARHTLGIFHGLRGGRQYRRVLAEEAPRKGAGIEVIKKAMSYLDEGV